MNKSLRVLKIEYLNENISNEKKDACITALAIGINIMLGEQELKQGKVR